MGYFKNTELTIDRFRDRVGVPQICRHAELRYAKRVLGLDLSEKKLQTLPALRDRCQRGILRNFEDANEVIASGNDDDIHHLFRRSRCLVMQGDRIITVYDTKSSGDKLDYRKKKIRRGRLPGIEAFEALRARRSA